MTIPKQPRARGRALRQLQKLNEAWRAAFDDVPKLDDGELIELIMTCPDDFFFVRGRSVDQLFNRRLENARQSPWAKARPAQQATSWGQVRLLQQVTREIANITGVRRPDLRVDHSIYKQFFTDHSLIDQLLAQVRLRPFYRLAILSKAPEAILQMIINKLQTTPAYSPADAHKDILALNRPPADDSIAADCFCSITREDYRDDLNYARAQLSGLQELMRYEPARRTLNIVIQMFTDTLRRTRESDQEAILDHIREGYDMVDGDLLTMINNRDNSLPRFCISRVELQEVADSLVEQGICRWRLENLGSASKTRLLSIIDKSKERRQNQL